MHKMPIIIAAVAFTLVGGARLEAVAQTPEAWLLPRLTVAPQSAGPFATLLDRGSDLELSSTQLGSIRTIQQRLVRENAPLLAQLRDAELFGVEDDAAATTLTAVRESFDANTRAAEREAEEVLSPQQREAANQLLEGASWAYGTPDGEVFNAGDLLAADAGSGDSNAEPATTVRIENLNFADATVYLFAGLQRLRLGFVTGLSTQTFTIPPVFLSRGSGFRFQVDPIARPRSDFSHEIMVRPGDQVLVRIPPR